MFLIISLSNFFPCYLRLWWFWAQESEFDSTRRAIFGTIFPAMEILKFYNTQFIIKKFLQQLKILKDLSFQKCIVIFIIICCNKANKYGDDLHLGFVYIAPLFLVPRESVFYIFSNNFESHSIYLFVDVCFCSFFIIIVSFFFFWLPCNYYNKLISIEYLIYWHLLLLWWWPSFHFRNGTQIVVLDDHASIKLFSALNIFFIMGCLVKHAQTQHKSHIIRPL